MNSNYGLQFKPLSENISEEIIALTAASLDTPLGGSTDVDEVIQYLLGKPGSWVVYYNDSPVGLFGLGFNFAKKPEWLLTSTLIFSHARGTGINCLLKVTVAQAALRENIKLAAIVRSWNARSMSAMAKAFPEVKPEPLDLKWVAGEFGGDEGYWYDLSTCVLRPDDESWINITSTISSWWASQKAIVLA